MIYDDATQLIGQTPLYRFPHGDREDVVVYAKLEQQNIGGSVKDRLGYYIIARALQEGIVRRGDTIVEPTAGNTGIGLAIAARHFGVSLIVTVPAKFSLEKQQLMKALGARVVVTPTYEGMDGAIEEAERLLQIGEAQYMPNQFENEWNPLAYETLAKELLQDVPHIDVLVAGGGSGGTLTGVANVLRRANPNLRTVLVQPVGATLLNAPEADYAIEGIGMRHFSSFMNPDEIDKICWVSDEEAFKAVKQLASDYALLVGSSSGAAYVAAERERQRATGETHIVTIFPDRAERYLQSNLLR